MGKFQSKHGEERAGGGRERGGWAPPLTVPSLFPVSSDRAAAAAACKRRESPEGEPGCGQGARRPRGRMRRAPSLGSALPRALEWDTPWVSGSAWPRGSGYRVGAARQAGNKRTPRSLRSPSFSVGALFPARLRAGRRGQLRGVCVRKRPQRSGRDRPARGQRCGTSRTGQAGRRREGGRGRATTGLAVRESCLFTVEMQKAHLAGQDSLALPSIWHRIPEGAGWYWNLPALGWTGGSTPEAGEAGEGILRQRWDSTGVMIAEFQA